MGSFLVNPEVALLANPAWAPYAHLPHRLSPSGTQLPIGLLCLQSPREEVLLCPGSREPSSTGFPVQRLRRMVVYDEVLPFHRTGEATQALIHKEESKRPRWVSSGITWFSASECWVRTSLEQGCSEYTCHTLTYSAQEGARGSTAGGSHGSGGCG